MYNKVFDRQKNPGTLYAKEAGICLFVITTYSAPVTCWV